jgi:3-hydroxybutyryl-CoA dehydrogenase
MEALVGVVGAGTMGAGVTQSLAETGHQVVVVDRSAAALERAEAAIRENRRLATLFRRLLENATDEDLHKRIHYTTDFRELARATFVIENVTEKFEVKAEVYAILEEHCTPETVFAANTSAIPITRIASATKRPSQVVGTHFMSPVPQKRTVEVVRGFHTSEATLDRTLALLEQMNKEGIVVSDSPGFVTNRVFLLTMNEAIFLVQDRVAPPLEIDRLFKGAFGHPMGPLETADMIGLDTILGSIEVLYESFADSKFRPAPLLKQMVAAGLLGRKSGRGFYEY